MTSQILIHHVNVFQLCSDLIEEWVRRNPKASICTVEGVSEFKNIALFQDYHGLPAFRIVWKLIHLFFAPSTLSLSISPCLVPKWTVAASACPTRNIGGPSPVKGPNLFKSHF